MEEQKNSVKVLNLMTGGQIGGIETLCYNWGKYAKFQNGFAFLTERGLIYEKMNQAGFATYDLTGLGAKISLKKIFALIKIAKDYDYIIVHHGDPILKIYYILLASVLNKKMISYVHSCYSDYSQISYGKIKRKLYEIIFQKAFDVSDVIIAVSKAGEISYKKIYSADEKKCHVVYNGISNELIKQGKENSVLNDGVYNLLYIGRLNKIKGVNLLLEAISVLREKYNICLSIVGDGPEKENLMEMSEKLNISTNIKFEGAQTEIGKYLKEANIFVYPSVCEEVFGISLVEALAHGIPCVANRVGGIPEIIKNEFNGMLTDNVSAEGLVKAIERLIKEYEQGKLNEYSRNAKESANEFTIYKNCEQVLEIIKNI